MASVSDIRRHWFGVDSAEAVARYVILMERNRIPQYQGIFDRIDGDFHGVFEGVTGTIGGRRISLVYSIGPAHIADCVEFLAGAFDISMLFATGSIGGLSADIGEILEIRSCTTMDGYTLAHFSQRCRVDDVLGTVVDLGSGESKIFTVPAVSWETDERSIRIRDLGYVGMDLETGPFLAACERRGVPGVGIHWVTDNPLERNFYAEHREPPERARKLRAEQHLRWLNLPRRIMQRVLTALDDL